MCKIVKVVSSEKLLVQQTTPRKHNVFPDTPQASPLLRPEQDRGLDQGVTSVVRKMMMRTRSIHCEICVALYT